MFYLDIKRKILSFLMHTGQDFMLCSVEKSRYSKRRYAEYIYNLASQSDIIRVEDRILVFLYFDQGFTYSRIARIMGFSESSVSRRIRKLCRRIDKRDQYLNVIRNSQFSPGQRNMALDYFIGGLSFNRIAQKRNTTIYKVRSTVSKINRLIEKKKTWDANN